MDENKTFNFKNPKILKYGENPYQKASLYSYDKELDYETVLASNMSYNNVLDSSLALEIAKEFYDVACCTIVKHENPCCVALASDIEKAYDKAMDSDPISPFDSTIAFTNCVNLKLAKKISPLPIKTIIAPSFENEAVEEFRKNPKLTLIKINTNYKDIINVQDEDIRLTLFGALVQEKNKKDLEPSTFKVAGKTKPLQQELEDMIFAYKVAKHTKTCAVVVAKDLRTIGICAGQTNRITCFELALQKVCDSAKGAVIASDGAITTTDVIQMAAQNRISAIIQPAGHINDKNIIQTADKFNISMITTGIRHFKN